MHGEGTLAVVAVVCMWETIGKYHGIAMCINLCSLSPHHLHSFTIDFLGSFLLFQSHGQIALLSMPAHRSRSTLMEVHGIYVENLGRILNK